MVAGASGADASFSLKFAAVILVAGATIAVVPLMLAEASARTQAENSAADRVSIAANLIDGQRASLAAFIAGVGRQLAAGHDIDSASAVQATLARGRFGASAPTTSSVSSGPTAQSSPCRERAPTTGALTRRHRERGDRRHQHRRDLRRSRMARRRVADSRNDRDRRSWLDR